VKKMRSDPIFLLAIIFVAWLPIVGAATPLADPIPGSIPTGPFVLKLRDVIPPIDFAIDPEMPPDGSGRIFVTLRGGWRHGAPITLPGNSL